MKSLRTNKNYLILVIGQVISLFGSAIQRFALSLYLLDLTGNASIPLIVEDKKLVAANGVVQQVSSLSNFLGPILAGVLYGLFGIKVVILINGISFILVIQMTFVQRATKQNMLGKVMEFSTAIATICVPIGQILYGYLVERFTGHMGGIVFLSGVLTFGVTWFVRWNVRGIK